MCSQRAEETVREDDYLEMYFLEAFCIFASLASLTWFILEIHPVDWLYSLFSIAHSNLMRYTSLLHFFLFSAGAYGIHRRVPVTWKLGWGGLGILFVDVTIRALTGWHDPLMVVLLELIVGMMGVWWKDRKSYFYVVKGGA